jgi:ADP-heptose:LPS heptosyltransferase
VELRGDRRPAVLVLRALNLGDLLVAVPALRALRRAYPAHRVVLAAPRVLAPVADLTGAVDELLPTAGLTDLRWNGPPPEVAVNLHGTGPQSHRALDAVTSRTRIGFRPPDADHAARGSSGWTGPDWARIAGKHPHERERWCALLAAHGVPADPSEVALRAPARVLRRDPPPVLVHPGARYGAKRWPGRRFAEVAAALERAGHHVLVTGSEQERPLARAVAATAGLPESRVVAGRTTLEQLFGLVAGAGLVISGDTGIAHIATAYRTPSVVLFGPVPPAQWGPPENGPHLVLTVARDRRGEPFAEQPDPALLGVTVPDVLDAARTLLAARTTQPTTDGTFVG